MERMTQTASDINSIRQTLASRNLLASLSLETNDWLCIDAFPRSANTYATYLSAYLLFLENSSFDHVDTFSYLQARHGDVCQNIIAPRLIHHQHDYSLVASLVQYGVPSISIIRNPDDSFASLFRYYGIGKDLEIAIYTANQYHLWIELFAYLRSSAFFRLISFEEAIANPFTLYSTLGNLGHSKCTLSREKVELISSGVTQVIREVDKIQHGELYQSRCAAPIDRTNDPSMHYGNHISGAYLDKCRALYNECIALYSLNR